MKHELWELRQKQSLPLDAKTIMTENRAVDWIKAFPNVHISFSGGKDSRVLLHILRNMFNGMFKDIRGMFVNTGLEYPEVREFAQGFENIDTVYPKMNFRDAIIKYGYPFISKEVSKVLYGARFSKKPSYMAKLNGQNLDGTDSKWRKRYKKYKAMLDLPIIFSNRCCMVMKEEPAQRYEKEHNSKPIIATMAAESEQRLTGWLKTGCNAFDSARPQSKPMSFWTEQDVLKYIKNNNLSLAAVYGSIIETDKCGNPTIQGCGDMLKCTGCQRTGCVFCGFGAHLDTLKGGSSRFVMLKTTHPKLYDYCMGGGEFNEQGIWQPSKTGLGMKFVIDELNKLYSRTFKSGKVKKFIEY